MHSLYSASSFLAALLLVQGTAGQSQAYQQCGGINWTGATTCVSGYTCRVLNDWYYQCVPGSNPPPASITPTSTAPITTRTTLSTATQASSTGAQPPPTTTRTTIATGGNPNLPPMPSTLLPSHYYIRAVATPNYRSYLQAQPTRTPGKAYLEDHLGAGQFRLEAGQLVHNIGEGLEPLYLNVERPADLTQRKLTTTFKTTKNVFGTFNFQGDTLTWSTSEIKRPNEAAWLVCENQELFINTGAFLYQTPAGCFDHTIHSYGGSTPDV